VIDARTANSVDRGAGGDRRRRRRPIRGDKPCPRKRVARPEKQRAPEAGGCGRANVTLHLMPCTLSARNASRISSIHVIHDTGRPGRAFRSRAGPLARGGVARMKRSAMRGQRCRIAPRQRVSEAGAAKPSPEKQRAPEADGCGRANVTLHLMPCPLSARNASRISSIHVIHDTGRPGRAFRSHAAPLARGGVARMKRSAMRGQRCRIAPRQRVSKAGAAKPPPKSNARPKPVAADARMSLCT